MDMKKLWPSLSMLLITLLGMFQEPITAFIAEHPNVSMGLATLSTLLANFVQSPKAAKE